MRFFIDCANTETIADICSRYPVSGITTNPTILSRESEFIRRHGIEVLLREIRGILGADSPIFFQLTQAGANTLLKKDEDYGAEITYTDAMKAIERLENGIGGKFVYKIAAHGGGYKLMEQLSEDKNIVLAATAVFSAGQAMLASAAGASYVAPFVNRYTKAGGDGMAMVQDIISVLDGKTEVLAASLGSAEQIVGLAKTGVKNITLPPALFDELSSHPMADDAVTKFVSAAETVY